MNCIYCHQQTNYLSTHISKTGSKTIHYACYTCLYTNKCSVDFWVRDSVLILVSLVTHKVIDINRNPRYLGPVDNIGPYTIGEMRYEVYIFMDKQITKIRKMKYNYFTFRHLHPTLITINSTSVVTPINITSFIDKKLPTYMVFS